MPEKQDPPPPFWPSLRRLLQLSGRHQAWLYLAIALDLALAAVILASNHILRLFFDAVLAKNQQFFFTALVLSLGLVLLNLPLTYFRTHSLGRFSEHTLYAIRQKIAGRLNRLPVSYLEERHSGDFLSVVNADLAKLKRLTGEDLVNLIGQAIHGVSALVYIFLVSWQLTLVSLVFTPLMFIVLSRLTGPVTRRTQEMQEKIGDLNSLAQDGLNGLPITKSFNLVKILDGRFGSLNRLAVLKGLSIARLRSVVDVLGIAIGFLPFLITFGFGGYLAITGVLTFGGIFAFINLLNYVVNPLGEIPRLVANISEALGAAQRIFQTLDHELERDTGTIAEPLRQAGPAIRFQDLSFAYESNTPVLQGVSFEIQPGEKIAVVGPSGSGKSTLLKLLLGFYPVEEGRIALFGGDLSQWQPTAARQQMAFVAQDTYLFPVSIEENIACGKPGAPRDAIEGAARAANIHGFIQSLPEAYGTPVGERGARLSGGQKQRIALARAILKDAPVLLLDEPTSALDSESEALVQEALDRLMAQHTSIVIAHRLSTIKNADRVLVMDEGKIVEQGTHEELLARGGLYQELYQRQFGLAQPGGPAKPGSGEGD
jgi:ABC-type multidrug transport system fused ATPase/permease subunit